MRVGLYSAHPFPWRPPASTLDDFQVHAIAELGKDPLSTVIRFDRHGESSVVRYAVADRMSSDCVVCHNAHPESPKTDWSEGDVRGVLEVAHPISASGSTLQADLELTVMLLTGAGISALAILMLTALRHRTVAAESQRMAEAAEAARAQVQQEMEARIIADQARIAAEAQAQHIQKMESLGVLAGGLAHDFNNLLVSIIGNTQLAQAKAKTEMELGHHLDLVVQAGAKAAALTEKLLEYAGDSPDEAQPMDLNSCIDALTPLLTAATGGHAILTLELEQGLPPIVADKTRVEQILLNLVTNATEASIRPGSPVTVRTGISDPDEILDDEALGEDLEGSTHVFLEVEDRGCGLDPNTRSKMFDPFFSTKGTGRGLGLSIILGIIKAHGGSVVVHSIPNEGTTFRIGFPTNDASQADSSQPVSESG